MCCWPKIQFKNHDNVNICFSQHTSCTWSLGNLAKKWTCLQAWRLAMCQFVAVWAEKLAIGIIEKFVSQVAHTRSDQLSHSSGWKMCRKNLHIVTLAKVGATCSCTVLHKGSFKHWWWHSLQRSWHRLVDLVTDMSLVTDTTDMSRQPSSTTKMHNEHCTCAKTQMCEHGKKQFQKPDNLQREAMHDKLCHVGIADC